jgi:hypothetical protein
VSYRKAIEGKKFLASHVAGYKMIVQHGETAQTGENLYSIDTGNDENIFTGHYFDMNKRHLAGNLQTMLIGNQIQETKTKTLFVKPESDKPKVKGDAADL